MVVGAVRRSVPVTRSRGVAVEAAAKALGATLFVMGEQSMGKTLADKRLEILRPAGGSITCYLFTAPEIAHLRRAVRAFWMDRGQA